jgi:hypothetical protein
MRTGTESRKVHTASAFRFQPEAASACTYADILKIPPRRVEDGDLGKVFIAIGVMVIMVVGVNVLFWRPLTAWAERFRVKESEAAEAPRGLVLNLLRRSHVPPLIGTVFG